MKRFLPLALCLALTSLSCAKEPPDEIAELRKKAEQGDASAQVILMRKYYYGTGVTQDLAEAVKWTRMAADQGVALAQCNLGVLYSLGEGVPQDYVEAMKWYRKAAEQGNAEAQGDLGIVFANGEGVPQDYVEAVKWYRMAAEQGDKSAQHSLAIMYDLGQGVPQDHGEAAKWYRLAAEQGLPLAQNNLGVSYENGDGVPQDYVEAYKWYSLAAMRSDDGEAAKHRDDVAIKMNPVSIAEAQKRGREWNAAFEKRQGAQRTSLATTPAADAEVSSIGYASVADALKDLQSRTDVTTRNEGGWTIIEDGDLHILWSFPPADHPAYPAAVRRLVTEKNDGVFIETAVLCEAAKAPCDQLTEDFKTLNDQMRASFAAMHAAPSGQARSAGSIGVDSQHRPRGAP